MISVQYIPLSVRVRAWNLSLFSREELEECIHDDTATFMAKVAKKEKYQTLDTSSSQKFITSTQNAILDYLNVALSNSSGSSKKFIKEIFHEFEIHNLKNVVRMIISGKFQDYFYPYEFTDTITLKKLSEIRSIGELIQLLDHTPYHMFRSILEQVEQEKNTLYWELALDNYYINRVHHVSQGLDLESKKAVKKLLLIPSLQERLVSLYRYKFHYNVESAEALKYVPNLSSLIAPEKWSKLAFATSHIDFYAILTETGYIEGDLPNNAVALKMEFQKQLEKTCVRFLHKDLTSISSFLAFIQLKKIQYRKITTILESKSLQVSKLDIMQFL